MDTTFEQLDPAIASLLPATGATPSEKMYALGLDDARQMHEERQSLARDNNAALTQQALALAKQADATTRFAAVMEAQAKEIPPSVFNEIDSLFHRCVFLGIETRKQSMTTTTSRDTVMKDVIYDGAWMGYQIYNILAADKGLPPKNVPSFLL